MKVLIVDDNANNRRLIQKQLRASGHTVIEAVNGRDALEKAEKEPPDILVTDILMPEMDGYQLCMEWKWNEKLKNIPVVFYTATYTSDEDRQFAGTIGVDGFIEKPTEFSIFLNILNELVDKTGTTRINLPREATHENLSLLMHYNKLLLSKLYQKVAQLEADIEKRKLTEQALIESEQKFESLVRYGNDSIVLIEEGKIQYANPKLFDLTGYIPEEGIGQPFLFFIDEAQRDFVKERYHKRLQGANVPSRYELNLKTKSGKVINVEVSASLITINNKVIEMAILRDITERKKSEEALRESEEKFRQFFENALVYCYMASPEGIILNVNNYALKALGYTREELIGLPLSKVYAPEYAVKASELINLWTKTGMIENEVLKIITKSGEKRDVVLSTGAIRGKDGNIVSTVSVQKDITDLKQSQEKAMQVETLTMLSKAKSELLSNVAHELRTPLASIKGFIETLSEPDVRWSKKQQMEFLQEAGKEVDVLNTLIRDLLDQSRIESGKMRLEKQVQHLDEILESAQSRLAILTANHVLKYRLEPSLPQVFVDKGRIAQVITNLVENATKFSAHGTQISIEAKKQGDNLVVSVRDKGMGMTQDTITKLFDRFYQAAQMTGGQSRGTGLGLSICRAIIEAHQGKIWVESSMGEGSVFSFSLPSAGPDVAR